MPTAYPQATQRTVSAGSISAEQLTQQNVAPPHLRDGEFIATLSSSSMGAPSYVIGQRVSGKPYERVIMNCGPAATPWKRIWRLSADRGAEVDYEIFDDTSSTGFVFVER